MDVTNLESGAVARETAGAQRRKTALVGQLGQRVGLIHELGERRGAEELLDRSDDRADVDQRLRRHLALILGLGGHPFADDTLHPREADAELVLQKLADRTDAAVSEMVDIVVQPHPGGEVQQIADGGINIINNDVLGNQFIMAAGDGVLESSLILSGLLENFAQHAEADLLLDGQPQRPAVDEIVDINHAVRDDLDGLLADLDINAVNARMFNSLGIRPGENSALLKEDFAGHRVYNRSGKLAVGNPLADRQLLIVFVTADLREVIPSGVKEQRVDVASGGIDGGRLAGAQLAVNLLQRLIDRLDRILLDGGAEQLVLPEEGYHLLIGRHAERTDEGRDGKLSVLVDPRPEHAVGIGLILEPCAAVGDDRRGKELAARLIAGAGIVDARRTDKLGDDNPLRAVDDEGAALGHERKITHKNFLLLDLAGLAVQEAGGDDERRGKGGITFLALFNRVLGFILQAVIDKVQHQVSLIVGDGRHILEDLFQPFLEEPAVGVLLYLDQVWHVQNFVNLSEAHANILTKVDGFHLQHRFRSLHSSFLFNLRAKPECCC